MPELIDRHALLRRVYEHPYERSGMTDAEWCRKCIYEALTIEPEVRHGRWIEATKHRDENGTILTDYECSECCAMVKDSDAEEIESERFCYNCGADMRVGADND